MADLDPDIYGRKVTMENDGSYDQYLLGGSIPFTFATGTASATAYLAFAKQGKLAQFKAAMYDFGQSHYDTATQQQLIALYLNAQLTLKINRTAYIAQALTWLSAVLTYVGTFMASVNSQTDPATIAAMNWDLSQIAADPMITIPGAIAINT